ncbi:MAG: diguanylate cyclase [Chloroflexota bacterium]|nr:diguanylate cyclase [Chloroflexota bacterium]
MAAPTQSPVAAVGLTFAAHPLPSLIGAILTGGLVLFVAMRRRSNAITPIFALLCGAAAVWCAGNALEFSTTALEWRVLWGKTQYLGSQSVPVLWLLFAVIYSGHGAWLRWWKIALLSVVPALTVAAVAAYPASQLVWVSFGLREDGQFVESATVRGPLFWLAAAYGYALVLTGIALIALVAFRSPALYRRQAMTLLLGAVVPLLANMTFVFGMRPLRMDTTPFAFACACLIFALGLFRYRLFDLAPIAREVVLDNLSDAVVVLDSRGRIVDANPAAIRLIRAPLSELLGMPAAVRLPFWSALSRYLSDPARTPETVVDERYGQVYELRAARILAAENTVAGLVVLLRNVSDRWQAEQALQRANAELAERVRELERRHSELSLLARLAEQLLSAADQQAIVDAVAAIAPQLFVGESGLVALREHDRFRVVAAWGDGARVGESLADDYSGRPWLPLPPQITVPLLDQGERVGLFVVTQTCARRDPEALLQLTTTAADLIGLALANLRLRDRLREESLRDPLTGLFNRRFLDDAIAREIQRADRTGTSLALLMLDLDHFKAFNDRYGHAAGDSALQTLGRFLTARLRATDIACRYGGEEFTLLLPATSREQALRIADRLREQFEAVPIVHAGARLSPLTLSIGVALYPEDGCTAQGLLAAADGALYMAKAAGRNRTAAGEPSQRTPPAANRGQPLPRRPRRLLLPDGQEEGGQTRAPAQ